MKFLNYTIVIIVLSLFVLSSCKKDEGEGEIVPKYLLDSELQTSAEGFSINNLKLLLSQNGMSDFANKIKYDIVIHTINYKTLFKGDTIIASGVVATPVAIEKKETFPVLSYQHGTIFKKDEAPSLNLNFSVNNIEGLMAYFASTGMVVVIADYIGFGYSNADYHPYLHNQYSTNAVLDMIRASKEFIKTEKPCEINNQLFLMGYSQGGSVTVGALSAIENNIANSDISVSAAVAGGGAYDLTELRDWIMNQQNYEQPSFIAYILESYSRYTDVGTDFDFSLVFSDDLPVDVKGLVDGINSQSSINSSFGTTYNGELFNPNFINDDVFATDSDYESMRTAFEENKIAAWPINSNLRIYHGNDDIWVPVDQSSQLFKDFQNQGAGSKVSLKLLIGMDHSQAAVATLTESISWFLDL